MVGDLFIYNQSENRIEINEPVVLMIKEFRDLFEPSRNKCKEDKTGKKGLRGFKELIYIYLMINWKSPYADDPDQDRHKYCLQDAELTEEDFEDSVFRAACRKYDELQNSSRSLRLIKAAQGIVDKVTVYFDTLDLDERNPVTQAPIFKTKDVLAEMQNVDKVLDALKNLEDKYKKEIEGDKADIRGDAIPGIIESSL